MRQSEIYKALKEKVDEETLAELDALEEKAAMDSERFNAYLYAIQGFKSMSKSLRETRDDGRVIEGDIESLKTQYAFSSLIKSNENKVFWDEDKRNAILSECKKGKDGDKDLILKIFESEINKIQPIWDIILAESQVRNKSLGDFKRKLAPVFKEIEKEYYERITKQREESAKNRLKFFRSKIDCEVKEHFVPLERNFNTAFVSDEYGGIQKDNRYKEFKRFLKSRKIIDTDFNRHKEPEKDTILWDSFKKLCKLIDDVRSENEQKGFDASNYPDDGHEFEKWVALSLEKFGWKAFRSPGSGDQGIDVLADLNDVSLGLQCKLYSGTVGNKAVQECLAGKGYYKLDHAVVITNSSYTRSAKELAEKTGIHLLGISDIPRLHEMFKND